MRHLRLPAVLFPVLMLFCTAASADTITDHFLLTYSFLGVTQSDNFAIDLRTYNSLLDPPAGLYKFPTPVYSGTDQSGTPDVGILETNDSGAFILDFKNSPVGFQFYIPGKLFAITRSAQDSDV